MRKYFWIYLLFSILCLVFSSSTYSATKPVILLEINNTINPAMQDYIEHGINYATKQKAELVILQLNTPGGLDRSVRRINKAILSSPIPVVTYLSPEGARVANAGIFILYASHIAAMAPGTHLGAASDSTLLPKQTANDASAYMRNLAQLRQRNAAWGELALRQAVSLTANEALKKKVINLIASNKEDLLNKLQATVVQTPGKTHYLQTKATTIETLKPGWRYQLLSVITNPNLTYILLLLGIYGLFFEFIRPGAVIPGLVGVISLLLAFYAFQLLPINYIGVTLLLGGIAGLVAEVFIATGFGILGVGGIIAFITGSIMLLTSSAPEYHLAWTVILMMSIITAGFFFLVLTLTKRSSNKSENREREELVGKEGEVLEYHADYVIVRVKGEILSAHCSVHLEVGQKILVEKATGMILTITPRN